MCEGVPGCVGECACKVCWLRVCVGVYEGVCKDVCARVCVSVCVRGCMFVCENIITCTHTHTHTHHHTHRCGCYSSFDPCTTPTQKPFLMS